MKQNAFVCHAKNPDPYGKVCCPNMKREAKKWAKLRYQKKTLACKTCCNQCVARIQKAISDPNDKLYIIRSNKLMKWNKDKSIYMPVFKLQTIEQVKKKDPEAKFRN